MILAWMLYSAFLAGVAGIAALALDGAARVLGRGTRMTWILALLFSIAAPAWLLSRSMVPRTGSGIAISEALLPPVVITASRSAVDSIVASITSAAAKASPVLLAAWLVATTVLLLRLVLGIRALRREQRRWTPSNVDGVPVLLAVDRGPAVIGIRRPTVVLPEWALALDPGLRHLVLQHELEHVRARDTVLPLLAALTTALLPWNPAVWWQANRLLLAAEVDCDARVLRGNARRERYGLLLLAIAQRQGAVMLGAALSEPTSHLERRIAIMHRSTPRHPVLLSTTLTAVAAIALMLACAAPAPAPDATASSASKSAGSADNAPFVAPPVEVTSRSPNAPAASAASAAPAKAYFEFKITRRAVLAPGNKAPRYPDALRAAGKEGEVLLQYVVDQHGAVEMPSLKVIRATDPAFVAAVREVLPTFRYVPAEVSGHAVKQLVQEPFMFTLSR